MTKGKAKTEEFHTVILCAALIVAFALLGFWRLSQGQPADITLFAIIILHVNIFTTESLLPKKWWLFLLWFVSCFIPLEIIRSLHLMPAASIVTVTLYSLVVLVLVHLRANNNEKTSASANATEPTPEK